MEKPIKLYNLTDNTSYKLLIKKQMTENFKSDAFLYLAFIVAGFATITETLVEKLLCIGIAVVILVIRSVMKKYFYK